MSLQLDARPEAGIRLLYNFCDDQRISSQSRELELKVTTRKPLYVYLDRVPFGAALTEPPPP